MQAAVAVPSCVPACASSPVPVSSAPAPLLSAPSVCPRRRESSCGFLLLTLDSAFPCAQASHSAGLEAAFQMGAVSASEGSSGGGPSEERFCRYIREQLRQVTANSLPVIEAAARWSAPWERQRTKGRHGADANEGGSSAAAADSAAMGSAAGCSPAAAAPAPSACASLVPFVLSHWRRHDRHMSLLLRLNQLSARASSTQGQALLKICTEVWGAAGAEGATDADNAASASTCSCSAHLPLTCLTADRTVVQLLAAIKTAWRTERLELHFVPLLGVIGSCFGVDAASLSSALLLLHLRALLSAGVRLAIVGPMQAQRLQWKIIRHFNEQQRTTREGHVSESHSEPAGPAPAAFAAASSLSLPFGQFVGGAVGTLASVASCNPLLDSLSALHERLGMRLFNT